MQMEPLIPEIEEGIPLPKNAAEALPELSPHEELSGIAETYTELADLTGTPLAFDDLDVDEAKKIAKKMIEDPKSRPNFNLMRDSTKAVLAGMITKYNFDLVDDLVQLKTFVINKLVEEVKDAPDSKTRIQALKILGEVDGIDAFKRRTETTHIIKPIEEVEKELMSVLEGIEYRVLDETPVDNN